MKPIFSQSPSDTSNIQHVSTPKQPSLPLHVSQPDIHVVLLLSHLLHLRQDFVQILCADLEILSPHCRHLEQVQRLYYKQCILLAAGRVQSACRAGASPIKRPGKTAILTWHKTPQLLQVTILRTGLRCRKKPRCQWKREISTLYLETVDSWLQFIIKPHIAKGFPWGLSARPGHSLPSSVTEWTLAKKAP